MFPLYDSSPRQSFPFINYAIIALNLYVFYLQIAAPDFEQFIMENAFIPRNFNISEIFTYIPLLTSFFMHGGIFHILSNLWFLHIFGDNVEDSMGHFGYLIFYLGAGIAAGLAQYVLDPGSTIPMLGASGAISGVAGAYFVLYSHSKIKALIPLGFFITTANLPVWFFLGYWFLIQLVSGVSSLATLSNGEGGVAWFAHVGGFIFGLIMARVLSRRPAPLMV